MPDRALAVALAPMLAAATIMACGVRALRILLPADLPPIVSIGLIALVGMLLYGGAMRVLAPETLATASAPFWRRVRPAVEGSAA